MKKHQVPSPTLRGQCGAERQRHGHPATPESPPNSRARAGSAWARLRPDRRTARPGSSLCPCLSPARSSAGPLFNTLSTLQSAPCLRDGERRPWTKGKAPISLQCSQAKQPSDVHFPRHWRSALLPVWLLSALLPVAPLSVSDYGERACQSPFCTPQPHQEFIP